MYTAMNCAHATFHDSHESTNKRIVCKDEPYSVRSHNSAEDARKARRELNSKVAHHRPLEKQIRSQSARHTGFMA
jgi:hypothetical protein